MALVSISCQFSSAGITRMFNPKKKTVEESTRELNFYLQDKQRIVNCGHINEIAYVQCRFFIAISQENHLNFFIGWFKSSTYKKKWKKNNLESFEIDIVWNISHVRILRQTVHRKNKTLWNLALNHAHKRSTKFVANLHST